MARHEHDMAHHGRILGSRASHDRAPARSWRSCKQERPWPARRGASRVARQASCAVEHELGQNLSLLLFRWNPPASLETLRFLLRNPLCGLGRFVEGKAVLARYRARLLTRALPRGAYQPAKWTDRAALHEGVHDECRLKCCSACS
jgi:hypothetical protein